MERCLDWSLVGAVIVAVCALSMTGFAQSDPFATSQPGHRELERLAERQGIAISRLSRLEDRMFQLSRVLSASEPDQAARLMNTLGAARGMLLRPRLEKILAEMRALRLSDAADEQARIVGDLERLLRILLDEERDPEARQQEYERLRLQREQLERIVKEQEEELKAAREGAAADQRMAALEALKSAVEALLGRQRDVTAQSDAAAKEGRAESNELAERQAELKQEADALAEQMKKAQDAPTELPAEAEQSAKQASQAMGQAGQALERGTPSEAKGAQQEAERQIEKLLRLLDEEKKKAEAAKDFGAQADAQRGTKDRTRALSRDMKNDSQPEGDAPGDPSPSRPPELPGDPKGGEGPPKPSGESPSQGSQGGGESPGQRSVDEAVPHQEKAEQKLRDRKPADAAKEQQAALDKLREAREALEDVLQQLRREQQEERLAALETRFAAMLEKQIEINKKTNRLDGVEREKWSRADQLELAEIAQSEDWIRDEAGKALKILEEDGTTIVVPQMVQQVFEDAGAVAQRLKAAETGPVVREMQETIVETLESLLATIRELQRQQEEAAAQGNQPGEESENPPLVPGSAELRLLKTLQLRLLKTTRELEQQRMLPDVAWERVQLRIGEIGKRQDDVARMALEMMEGERKRP